MQNQHDDEFRRDGQSYSRGWNAPRGNGDATASPYAGNSYPGENRSSEPQPGEASAAYTHTAPGDTAAWSAHQQQPQQAAPAPEGQTPAGPQVSSPQPAAPEKKRRGLSWPGALALMLAGSIVSGIGAGAAVQAMNKGNHSTATVNEALHQGADNDKKDDSKPAPAPAEGSTEDVAAKVTPAVVAIQVATGRGASEGSGSIISSDGYVLTNHHVIAEAAQRGQAEIRVTLNDGSKHEAEYVASDPNTDVGVIKIKDGKDLPTLKFGDSDGLRVGQEVVAVGSPLGLNVTVTSGIVSALNRPVRAAQDGGELSLIDAVQTDAAVNPGNSGGPLVDMDGNIVGMNSMIASLSAQSGQQDASGSIGLGFAIPSNFAKRMADELINNGEVKHPMLGVKVDARNPVDGGAYVVDVEPGSPADKAGIERGDVITRVNDRLVEDSDTLIAATRSKEFGATVTLEVADPDGENRHEVEVTLSDE